MNKRKAVLASVSAILLIITAASEGYGVNKTDSETDKTEICISEEKISIKGNGAAASDNSIRILSGGLYDITGFIDDGQISVDCDDDVTLLLDGLEAHNENNPVIIGNGKGTITISSAKGTENILKSGAETEISGDNIPDAEGAAVYIKGNLILDGEGVISVEGYQNNGMQSKASISVDGGTIEVTAVNHGLKAKYGIFINTDLTIKSGADGLKTTEGDSGIEIDGGNVSITSYADAVDSSGYVNINKGNIAIITSGEEIQHSDFDFQAADDDNTAVSAKGIKAAGNITVNGGTINIDSTDDSIHSDTGLIIEDGEITVSSGDDGLHAENTLTINGGTLNITESYEGIEAHDIIVNSGNISLISKDDGFNANGGSSMFDMSSPMTMNSPDNESEDTSTDSETLPTLKINGGTIYVNADGDGLDSNGDLSINGGEIVVDGPSNSGNGALDSGTESGGKLTVSGGTVLALGASGMAETFEDESTQPSFQYTFAENFVSGDIIKITDSDGNVIFEHEVTKNGNNIVFSSGQLEEGKTYIVYVIANDSANKDETESENTQAEITIEGISTSLSEYSNGTGSENTWGMAGGQGGFGGNPVNAGNRPTGNENQAGDMSSEIK